MTRGPTCFVTGGTGFLGRHLIAELLRRDATVYALVRPGSARRLALIVADLEVAADRLLPVLGDLALPATTLEPFTERVDHLFHLAAIYDMDADPEAMARANVEGTRSVLDLARRIGAGTFHMVSSVAAAGNLTGTFPEEDPRHGQGFPHRYHRSKFDSEVLVRDTATMPFRVYRPGTVVGTSDTGQTDKLDGAYALFPLASALGALPAQMVIPVPRLGRLPTVPVDRCAQAIAEIALAAGPHSGDTFGLYSAQDERVHEVLGALVRHAGGPRLAPVLPEVTGTLSFVAAQILGRVPVLGDVRDRALNAAGVSPGLVDAAPFRCRFTTQRTDAALVQSGITIPALRDYVPSLWDGWLRRRAQNALT